MNCTAGMLCSLSRKWLPTAACSTSLTRLAIVPTMLITRGAVVSGTWICTTRSIVKTKPSRLLATICERRSSSLWAWLTASDQLRLRMAVGTCSAS